jgi:hypothetical protein
VPGTSIRKPVTSNKVKGPLKLAEPGLVGAHERKYLKAQESRNKAQERIIWSAGYDISLEP